MIQADELKAIPIFDCLTDAQRQRVAQTAADVYVRAGETVIREGDIPFFFVLLEGSLDVLKEFGGRDTVVNSYKPGEFFGEVPLLLGSAAIASLRAKEFSRMVRMDGRQFKELIDSSPECSAVILKTMTDRVNRIQNYMVDHNPTRVLVVGSQYNTDCRDIRSFLSTNRIPYEWGRPRTRP